MGFEKTYTVEELCGLLAHLDNGIPEPKDKMGKLKRMRIPIPVEYGGGIVTGYGYDETVRNLIERVKSQVVLESDKPTFRECWEKWIGLKEGQERSPSTIANYKYLARVHLLPFFGEKHMDKITPDDIQEFFNRIMNLSKATCNHCKTILCGIFDRAVRMQIVDRNIMLYRYERSKKVKEKVVLQDEDLIEVIRHLEDLKGTGDIRDYLYFCFLCFTALRRGEVLGLRWKDVDFDYGRIFVRNNVTFPNGCCTPVIREPKDGSFGTVHLQSELAMRIRPYAGFGNAYVLPYNKEETDRPMTRSMFDKMWKRIGSVIDLKGTTSHSFRASYATMMNAHCDHIDPKALQGALRHKTPDLAIKVYTKENTDKTRIAEMEYDKWLAGKLKDAR